MLQPQEEILALQFGIGIENGDFVVGIGLPHQHVQATCFKQPFHGLITLQIAHHHDTLGIQQALHNSLFNWSVDKRQQRAVTRAQKLICCHLQVIITLHPIQLALQHPHSKWFLAQAWVKKVQPTAMIHLKHGKALDACGGTNLQDVARIEEIGYPEQQPCLTLGDEIHLTTLPASSALPDSGNQVAQTVVGIVRCRLAPHFTNKAVGVGGMYAEAATAMVAAPSIEILFQLKQDFSC